MWQIYGENLAVTALGITVTDISISKTVSPFLERWRFLWLTVSEQVVLDGMNGFKFAVQLRSASSSESLTPLIAGMA